MKEKTTCYEIMLKQEEQDKERRRLLVLLAVEKVCNLMVERYQGQIDSGELTVDDIVNIGNNYIKTLLLALVVFISGCFLNPFRGSPKEDISFKEAPLEEVLKEEPPDEAFMTADASGYAVCPTVPTTTDTMVVAVVNGGMDNSVSFAASVPWYAGQATTAYDDAGAVFIKKGGGPWLFQGMRAFVAQANRYPVIASYNASFKVFDWFVLGTGDSLYNPYLKPKHYHSATGTDAVQFFDDAAEVGAAYDSVNGDFVFASNAVVANGADPGGPKYITTAAMGDSNIYGYYLTNLQDDNAEGCGLVFRRDASDGSYIGINVISNGNLFRIDSFNGTTFTARASVAVSLQVTSLYIYVVAGAVIDSTCYAWFIPQTGDVLSLSYTSAANTQYGKGKMAHGIRIGTTGGTGIKFMRWYETGRDGEFAGLDNFLTANSFRKRIKQVSPQ